GLGERVGHLPGVSREEFVRRVASRWELPAPGEPRHGAGAAAAPGVLWLAGGTGTAGRPLGEVLRFDLAAWRWERLPSLPGEEGPAGPVALVALGGDLYALAGAGLLALPAGAAGWERLPPPPTPRARLGATALEGRLYAVGGLDGRGQALATVEVYDPAAGRWSAGPPLPSPRSDLGVASLDGSLVAAGGADTEGHYRAEGWRLETRTWTWTPIPPLPEPLRALALASDGRRLHAVGGYGPGGPSGRVLVWARGEAAWREAARLPSAREYAAAAADPTEGLYVVGGYRGGEVEGDAWVFRVD
ncbi:MAG: hypothetical protein HY722_13840, partial [Planctomycetes bacterium]|nr:hypothetical protein [Planctomycetota bacterium]